MNYYNEIDPFAANWLRNLIAAGEIPAGDVDERSIVDVRADDLRGYDQCHFFAGIGGWPYALRLAGWEGPAWTGSCPCQPFSVAGSGKGTADERDLWPAFFRLIEECGPPIVFGEQVAGAAGELWIARVRADLEERGYAVGAADLPAAGVSAPHIRQRFYWMAHTQRDGGRANESQRGAEGRDADGRAGENSGLAHAEHDGSHRTDGVAAIEDGDGQDGRLHRGSAGGLGDTEREGLEGHAGHGDRGGEPGRLDTLQARPVAATGWDGTILIECGDGKSRRAPSGVPLLAHGIPGRVGLLRGFGNAIVPPLAAEFIAAAREALDNIRRDFPA